MSGTKQNLFCICLPDIKPRQHLVQIKKDDNYTVTDLKHIIKNARSNAFADIDACDLNLWKVSIPFDDNLEETLMTIDFGVFDNRLQLLDPHDKISIYFGNDISPDIVHILVELPVLGEYITRFSYSTTEVRILFEGYTTLVPLIPSNLRDNPIDLREGRQRYKTTFPPKAPSSQGIVSAFAKLQQKETQKIVWSRPPGADAAVPVTLMHPIFREFIDGCGNHQPTKEDNELVLKLMESMSGFFADEHARASKLREILSEYGIPVVTSTISSKGREFRTDGAVEIVNNLVAIVEVKEEISSKGAEPYAQVVLHYTHSTLEKAPLFPNFNFPALLITVFGQTLPLLL